MLYYSEETKQFYKTEKELKQAEAKVEEAKTTLLTKQEEEKKCAKFKKLLDACDNINKVRRQAAEDIIKAENAYDDMKAEFIKVYGIDEYNALKEREDEFLYSNKYYLENILTADTDGDKTIEVDTNSDFEKAFGFGEMIQDIFDYFDNGWKK